MRGMSAVRRPMAFAMQALAVCAGLALYPHDATAAAWVNTATQALPLKNVSGLAPLSASTPMHITVGLAPRNKSQLDAFVVSVSTPGNPAFAKVLTPEQFLAQYAPTKTQTDAVMSYLTSAGFSHLSLSANHMAITADGSAATVQSAFNTQLVQFALGGKRLFANSSPAMVPAQLQGTVAAVLGLHNVAQAQTMLAQNIASGKVLPQAVDRKRNAAAMPAAIGVPQISPIVNAAAFQTAYDAGATPTGWGTSIGIVTEGDITQVPLDLRQYEKENNLPQVPYEIVQVGPASSDTAGTDEWDLDSQSSSGIAGNLRSIVFYNTASLGDADLIPTYQRIVAENRVKAVNMSYGGCETLEYLSGAMLLSDLAYEQGVAQGITFFASSGDAGAACGLLINLGLPDTGLIGAVEYPSSSPYVVAVGGTSLLIDKNNAYISELSWDGGGGGNSLWETAPSWQSGVVPLGGSPLGLRGVPDVAMDADNNLSPALVVVSGADTGVGGTSLSSPLSAGTWARMQTAHGNCYGFAAPIFYHYANGLLKKPTDFHDIIVGTNGLYVATPGYDYTTGIGSFDIAKVNADLPPVSCAPEAPVSVTAAVISGHILLNWTGSAGATSYAIYVGTATGAESGTPLTTTSNTSSLVSGLVGGKTYYFVVKAVNSVGSSPASNEASVALPLPPAAPTALTAKAGNGSATLSWTASSAASSYEVFQGSTAGGESTVPVSTGISGTSVVIGGLSNGSSYFFIVKAVNDGGESAKSNEAKAALPAPLPAPGSVKAVAGTASVKLTWTAVAGASSYSVYQAAASGAEGSTPVLAGVTGTSTTLTGLSSGHTYFFQLTTVGSTGVESSKHSIEVSATAK